MSSAEIDSKGNLYIDGILVHAAKPTATMDELSRAMTALVAARAETGKSLSKDSEDCTRTITTSMKEIAREMAKLASTLTPEE